jgi:hypothetical protein
MGKIERVCVALGMGVATVKGALASGAQGVARIPGYEMPAPRALWEINWFDQHPETAILFALVVVVSYGLFVRFVMRHYETMDAKPADTKVPETSSSTGHSDSKSFLHA